MIVTENYEKKSKNITVRIYSLMKTDNDSYLPYHEMEAFFQVVFVSERVYNATSRNESLRYAHFASSPYNTITS
ncbi:hypothetical protein V7266_03465 [Neobacillus drentensis]|uniref:hypothetical protein n=1 Tax=Neobacillus drentensis TaxID=220684 RepID=UPI002FFF73EA